ncbi:MAG TPA: C40 family peptidase [Gaiellaceae bacterium]|jgi:cell wall-associated NlpC family hydrolase
MSDRLRFSLLVFTIAAAFSLRAAGALASPTSPVVSGIPAQNAQVTAVRSHVVTYARRFVGVPYSYGGTTPATGFDCSGFVRFVYAHFGIELPHYSAAQFHLGRKVRRDELEPGDLVFFSRLGHVGLYVGDGRFIHAPHSGARVSIEPLAAHRRYDGARRLL